MSTVLLKLSGEAFGGGSFGIDLEILNNAAEQIILAKEKTSCNIAIVLGGGNFFRGSQLTNMQRSSADNMGMLSTILNAIALKDAFEKQGAKAVILSSIKLEGISEKYSRDLAYKAFKSDEIVILGGGLGVSHLSTDTTAAQRSLDLEADIVLFAKNGVDGVYTDNPKTNPSAIKIDNLTYKKALAEKLEIIDITAFYMFMQNNLPIRIFGMDDLQNIYKAICLEKIGTFVHN